MTRDQATLWGLAAIDLAATAETLIDLLTLFAELRAQGPVAGELGQDTRELALATLADAEEQLATLRLLPDMIRACEQLHRDVYHCLDELVRSETRPAGAEQ